MAINKAAVVLTSVVGAVTLLHAGEGTARLSIASIAPSNSAYVNSLRAMGDAVKKRTDQRLTWVVKPAGDETESSLLINMSPGFHSLDAAQISAITLGNVDKAFNVFGLPMFFESYAEVDRVLDKLAPELDKRLMAKDYKVLNLAYAGWVRVFSKEPVKTVADLKRLKLFTSTGDPTMANWYKNNGFTAIQADPTAIMPGLKTNYIQAVPAPPAFAQVLGYYRDARYMMDIGFAPLIGATVMSLERWKSLSPADQKILLEEAKKAGDQLRSDVPKLEAQAIEQMSTGGFDPTKTNKKGLLTVVQVDKAEWRRMGEQLGESMRKDGVVPGDIYEIARRERDAFRAGK